MGGLRVFPLSEVNKFIENEKQAEAEKRETIKVCLENGLEDSIDSR